MNVLVTGGGGFLGRALVEKLTQRGHRVRIFSRGKYPEIEAFGVEGYQGDIRDPAALDLATRGVEAVFHVAAKPGIWGDVEEFRSIHVKGTENILNACARNGVAKLIFTSSPSVVFNMRDEKNIDETVRYPQKFYNPYSETKAWAEELVLHANGRNGLLTCALRPHLIWGPRDTQLLPRLIQRGLARQLRIIGSGKNEVDLTYIDNAVHAHLLAHENMSSNRIAGEAYFISDGRPVVLWDWINRFLAGLKIPPVTRHVPEKFAYAVGALYELMYTLRRKTDEPPMTRFLCKALACSHHYNISNARRDLGYEPLVRNDEGLRRTLEYFQRKMAESRAPAAVPL